MLHMFASDPAGSFEGPPARPECSSFLQPRLQPFSYGVYETFFDCLRNEGWWLFFRQSELRVETFTFESEG